MGGGSGLLCLRTTVALRIRVPPTFHPGPQLPTTAHGARPAPAHHGPAPPRHLSPRTDNPPPSSSFSALCLRQPRSSATPPPSRNQENRPTSYSDVTCHFLELWKGRRNLERWLKEEIESQVHLNPYIKKMERFIYDKPASTHISLGNLGLQHL